MITSNTVDTLLDLGLIEETIDAVVTINKDLSDFRIDNIRCGMEIYTSIPYVTWGCLTYYYITKSMKGEVEKYLRLWTYERIN